MWDGLIRAKLLILQKKICGVFFHPQTFEKTTEGKARTVRYKLADDSERNNYPAHYKELVVETYALYQRDISHPSVCKGGGG